MKLELPNGQPLMHKADDGLFHEYDAAYARAYYLRTRKLKGRKKAAAVAKAPDKGDQKVYRAKLDNFLKKLPMAREGADLKATEAFVDKMRKMSDAEMKAEAERIKKEKGNNDGAQVATIEALLKNRERTRKSQAAKKPAAKQSAKKPAAKTKPLSVNREELIKLGKRTMGTLGG